MEQSSTVDGRGFFSTSSSKPDDGSQSQKKADSAVVKSPPGGQISDAKIIRTLASYLWMKDNPEFRFRVVAALFLLVGAKVSEMVNYLVERKFWVGKRCKREIAKHVKGRM